MVNRSTTLGDATIYFDKGCLSSVLCAKGGK